MKIDGSDAKTKVVAKTEVKDVAKADNKPKTISDYLNSMTPEIAKAVPRHVTPERITRIALTAVRVNPRLLECTRDSLLAGVMTSAQLGLEPNTPLGQCYLIPRQRSVKVGNQWEKVWEVSFQLGYLGLIDLAYRSGEYKDIYVELVYEKDEFIYSLGLNRDLVHVPNEEEEDRGKLTHVYGVYHTKNGGYDFKVWGVNKIIAHAKKYSGQSFDPNGKFKESSAWGSNFEGMAKKTVLKDLLKYAPKSIEFAKMLENDETVKHEIAPDMSEVPAVEIDITAEAQVIEPEIVEQPEGLGL